LPKLPEGGELTGFTIVGKAATVFALLEFLAQLEKAGIIKLC